MFQLITRLVGQAMLGFGPYTDLEIRFLVENEFLASSALKCKVPCHTFPPVAEFHLSMAGRDIYSQQSCV